MSRFAYPLARWILLVVAVSWMQTESSADAPAKAESKSVKLEIKVPPDAEVFIDDVGTKSTGPVRKYESEPVAANKRYVYKIKAVWKGPDGKEVVREVKFPVTPGKNNVLDLTGEAKETPKTAGLKLEVPPGAVEVEVGGKKSIPLKVTRENFKGPVKVTFSALPAGVQIEDVTIPADKSEGNAAVSADKYAKGGPADILARAEGGGAKAEAKIKLSIKAAATAGKLTLEPPPALDIDAGGKKNLTLKVKREDLKGPVKVTFSGLPKDVKIEALTIPEDKSEGTTPVTVEKDAKAGPVEALAHAESGSVKAQAPVKLAIKAPAKPKDKEEKPKGKEEKPKGKE